MEKHRCSLCFRRFSSGRALGGHMRSHVTPATPSRKLHGRHSSAAEGAEEEEAAESSAYGRRDYSRNRFSAFASVGTAVPSSDVVQDGESEREFPRAAATAHRRRPSPDPASSASDITTEEDVALCLMLLSRDFWTAGKESPRSDGNEEGNGRRATARRLRPPRRGRSKYQCGKCKKAFRSYQALGEHRAIRHKPKGEDDFEADMDDAKVHECPFCFRVFPSGQALGGHKRSHLTPSTATTNSITSPSSVSRPLCSPSSAAVAAKYIDSLDLIDLNLPAPVDDDVALSTAVSEAEVVDKHTAR